MPKKDKSSAVSADPDGMAVIVSADAIAVGEDTLTIVDTTSEIVDHNDKIKVKGTVTAVAAAEAPEDETAFTNAEIDVLVSGADKVKTKDKTIIGENGIYTETEFKAKDNLNKDGETKVIYKEKVTEDDDFAISVDGNVATVSVDAQAVGENTLVDVDAFALAIEDELSLSTVVVTSGVD